MADNVGDRDSCPRAKSSGCYVTNKAANQQLDLGVPDTNTHGQQELMADLEQRNLPIRRVQTGYMDRFCLTGAQDSDNTCASLAWMLD